MIQHEEKENTMNGKTHRVGGMLCVLAGFTYLESKGMLLRGVNPILQITVMYPFAIYGSIFPDLDHEGNSIPSKDIVSVSVNKILHLASYVPGDGRVKKVLNAKHRSWQTHSDLFFLLLCFLLVNLLGNKKLNSVESIMVTLIGSGFILGVISHLILDMLTPQGIWCVGLVGVSNIFRVNRILPRKIRLVPNTHFYSTNGPWEGLVRKILWCLCVIFFVRIIYLMSPYRFVFEF